MICNNPIRVKFVIVYVNTVGIRSTQQNVAFRTFQLLLYSKMGNYACNSRFSILKYTSKLHALEIYFGGREIKPPDHAICPLVRYVKRMKLVRFVYFNEEMILFSGSE